MLSSRAAKEDHLVSPDPQLTTDSHMYTFPTVHHQEYVSPVVMSYELEYRLPSLISARTSQYVSRSLLEYTVSMARAKHAQGIPS